MSMSKPEWWDWVDLDTPGNEPLKLLEDAPEEIKKIFEEWKKQKTEEEAQGGYI